MIATSQPAKREYGESRTKMAQVRKLAGALGLGHFGTGDAVMPGQGRAVERPYTLVELAAMNDAFSTLGETTFEVYLNAGAFWRNVPAEVWTYKLGGYQVLKKWLSYRERNVSGRSLRPDEVQHFTDTARDTHHGATEKQTRNSAEKTSLIEIVHFLLGADCKSDSLLRSPELVEHSFVGHFSFGDHLISVERSGTNSARVYLLNGFDGRRNLPIKTEKGSKRQYLSNEYWKVFLGHLLFGLPEDLAPSVFGESYTPTFRSMISYFARRQQSGGFISPERQAERQQRWDWQENLSYLFGLDWRVPYEFQKVRLREKALEELRKAAKGGAFGEIIGTVAELRPAVAVAEKRAEERKFQLKEFRVHESYDDLAAKAASAKSKMQAVARDNVMVRETLNHLEKALEQEIAPESRELEKVYQAVNVELPNVTLKRLNEVRAFYESVVENRRLHLNHEIGSLQEKIQQNFVESEQLDAKGKKYLRFLKVTVHWMILSRFNKS